MFVVFGHVGGVPVEESLPALLPALGLLTAAARLWLQRLRQEMSRRSRIDAGRVRQEETQ